MAEVKHKSELDDPSYVEREKVQPMGAEVGMRGSVDASKTLANVSRAQWDDFKQRISPYVEKLGDIAAGPSDSERAKALGERDDQVATQFDNAEGAAARRSESFGLAYDPSQGQKRSTAMDKAAATVGSRNQYRADIENRKSKALTGAQGGGGLGLVSGGG